MSAWVSAVASGSPVLVQSDQRHVEDEWVRSDDIQPAPFGALVWLAGAQPALDEDFITGWWPNSSGAVSDAGLSDVRGQFESPSQRIWPNSGSNGRLSFVGVTRDQYGSAIGSCTVRCFRVSTNELQSTVVSDASTGAFTITSPYNDAHFLTVHLTSTPNIAGATVDTLIPS